VRYRVALLAAGLALAAGPAAGQPALDLRPHPVDVETWTETLTVIADLTDGSYVQLQLAVTNLGPGSGHGVCRALVSRATSEPWTASQKHDRWRHATSPAQALTIGSCRATVAERLTMAARVGGAQLRVELAGAIGEAAPPDGRVRAAGRFYDYRVLVPWGPARVSLQLPGEGRRTLSGHGHADRSRSTALPSDLARRWVRLRVLGPPEPTLILARFPAGGDRAVGWAWTTGQAAPVRLLGLDLERSGGTESRPTWRVRARTAKRAWRFASEGLLFRHAPVEELGLLGSVVGAWVGSPVTFTHRARLRHPAGDLQGLLEVTVVDG